MKTIYYLGTPIYEITDNTGYTTQTYNKYDIKEYFLNCFPGYYQIKKIYGNYEVLITVYVDEQNHVKVVSVFKHVWHQIL